MSLRTLMRSALRDAERPRRAMMACVFVIALSAVFPTDMQSYHAASPDRSPLVVGTDSYLRFVNTAVQIAMPVMLGDEIGMAQLALVALSTTAATHFLKHLLNNVTPWGVRLGERPRSPGSGYNMPSGHSSMSSCALYFVGRRYGWWHLLYMLPILLLTMYARVGLHAHTMSAVIAGAVLGILVAMLFTGRKTGGGNGRDAIVPLKLSKARG